ncbi:ABC transporter permease [Lacrimispora algidixylanolytica]|uniref:ABC transporter permease n=1 Tax=Lacrimispora algidixylanolytica TaxID=94868 RepID=A0A419SYJ8_9FIRM|nr:sugar ABC transporter permease [Lacrimispora algidixylanolytica]RKD30208.1 ABC transporter permease [Lacrimispora algidixylanolytica]
MNRIRKFFQFENIGYLYVLPALLYMMYFVGYPIIRNIVLSLQNVTVKTLNAPVKELIGLNNYLELFRDKIMINSLINTLVFTVACLIVQFMIGFALALFLSRKFASAKMVRGLLMIPWMIPITVTALIFKFIFSTNVGILNQSLMLLKLISAPVDWLTSPGTAMFALVFANIWIGIPFNMILLSTGLTIIPTELYESASIDGANRIQSFFRITLPLLKPTIESVLVLGFIYTFKVFDLVYVMTGGGPVNSTHMLSTYAYKLSFGIFQYSKGAAVANIMFVVLLIVSLFYLKLTYEEEEA